MDAKRSSSTGSSNSDSKLGSPPSPTQVLSNSSGSLKYETALDTLDNISSLPSDSKLPPLSSPRPRPRPSASPRREELRKKSLGQVTKRRKRRPGVRDRDRDDDEESELDSEQEREVRKVDRMLRRKKSAEEQKLVLGRRKSSEDICPIPSKRIRGGLGPLKRKNPRMNWLRPRETFGRKVLKVLKWPFHWHIEAYQLYKAEFSGQDQISSESGSEDDLTDNVQISPSSSEYEGDEEVEISSDQTGTDSESNGDEEISTKATPSDSLLESDKVDPVVPEEKLCITKKPSIWKRLTSRKPKREQMTENCPATTEFQVYNVNIQAHSTTDAPERSESSDVLWDRRNNPQRPQVPFTGETSTSAGQMDSQLKEHRRNNSVDHSESPTLTFVSSQGSVLIPTSSNRTDTLAPVADKVEHPDETEDLNSDQGKSKDSTPPIDEPRRSSRLVRIRNWFRNSRLWSRPRRAIPPLETEEVGQDSSNSVPLTSFQVYTQGFSTGNYWLPVANPETQEELFGFQAQPIMGEVERLPSNDLEVLWRRQDLPERSENVSSSSSKTEEAPKLTSHYWREKRPVKRPRVIHLEMAMAKKRFPGIPPPDPWYQPCKNFCCWVIRRRDRTQPPVPEPESEEFVGYRNFEDRSSTRLNLLSRVSSIDLDPQEDSV